MYKEYKLHNQYNRFFNIRICLTVLAIIFRLSVNASASESLNPSLGASSSLSCRDSVNDVSKALVRSRFDSVNIDVSHPVPYICMYRYVRVCMYSMPVLLTWFVIRGYDQLMMNACTWTLATLFQVLARSTWASFLDLPCGICICS